MVVHACNPSTQRLRQEDWEFRGYRSLHRETLSQNQKHKVINKKMDRQMDGGINGGVS
jgi:hypothetical protein